MQKWITTTFLLLYSFSFIYAQDTFSIVAVDTLTGEVGSAGASCLDDGDIAGGAIIISDVLPNKGAIHTQSYWSPVNQQFARNRMVLGDSPQQIINWLASNDAESNPSIRQYGIVDLYNGGARSAAYTGVNCFDYKNHITGVNYAIQGNILLGQSILDSMEAGFVNTSGSLADKLMAALQGANVAGADTRCLSEGVSSQSAFIRVAQPNDSPTSLYLDLNVSSTPFGVEPIDELQTLYNAWTGTSINTPHTPVFSISPNPAQGKFRLEWETSYRPAYLQLELFDVFGRSVYQMEFDELPTTQVELDLEGYALPSGIYVLVANDGQYQFTARVVWVD